MLPDRAEKDAAADLPVALLRRFPVAEGVACRLIEMRFCSASECALHARNCARLAAQGVASNRDFRRATDVYAVVSLALTRRSNNYTGENKGGAFLSFFKLAD